MDTHPKIVCALVQRVYAVDRGYTSARRFRKGAKFEGTVRKRIYYRCSGVLRTEAQVRAECPQRDGMCIEGQCKRGLRTVVNSRKSGTAVSKYFPTFINMATTDNTIAVVNSHNGSVADTFVNIDEKIADSMATP